MSRVKTLLTILTVSLLALFASARYNSAGAATALPDPKVDQTLAAKKSHEKIVVAGGCFWGVQAVFEHVRGVSSATSGYAGGTKKNPVYEEVGTGQTGHAESVEIVYDPSKITLGQLLKVFFSVAHDPTELNYQGPDHGTQYRSAIFFSSPEQQRIAQAYVAQLDQAKVFPVPIVTQIAPLNAFYRAEEYHQDYATLNPDNPYIARYDLPKLKDLQHEFPNLYKGGR
jgi:peptide-methionine (S)-S-oxide reductase